VTQENGSARYWETSRTEERDDKKLKTKYYRKTEEMETFHPLTHTN
jgi:hypothetical protein